MKPPSCNKHKTGSCVSAASVSCAVDSTGSLLLDPDTSEEQVCQCATLVSCTVTLDLSRSFLLRMTPNLADGCT